jgi:hypothetical protein
VGDFYFTDGYKQLIGQNVNLALPWEIY